MTRVPDFSVPASGEGMLASRLRVTGRPREQHSRNVILVVTQCRAPGTLAAEAKEKQNREHGKCGTESKFQEGTLTVIV